MARIGPDINIDPEDDDDSDSVDSSTEQAAEQVSDAAPEPEPAPAPDQQVQNQLLDAAPAPDPEPADDSVEDAAEQVVEGAPDTPTDESDTTTKTPDEQVQDAITDAAPEPADDSVEDAAEQVVDSAPDTPTDESDTTTKTPDEQVRDQITGAAPEPTDLPARGRGDVGSGPESTAPQPGPEPEALSSSEANKLLTGSPTDAVNVPDSAPTESRATNATTNIQTTVDPNASGPADRTIQQSGIGIGGLIGGVATEAREQRAAERFQEFVRGGVNTVISKSNLGQKSPETFPVAPEPTKQPEGKTDVPGAMPGSQPDDQATTVGTISGKDQEGINEPVDLFQDIVSSGPSGDGLIPGAMPGSQPDDQATTTVTISEDAGGARSEGAREVLGAGIDKLQSGVYTYTKSNPEQAEAYRENVVDPLVQTVKNDGTKSSDIPGAMPGSQPDDQATTAATISEDATGVLDDGEFQAGLIRGTGNIIASGIEMSGSQRSEAVREDFINPVVSQVGGEAELGGESDAPGAMPQSKLDEQATTAQTIAEKEQEGIGEADALRQTFLRGAGGAAAGAVALPSVGVGATESAVKGTKYTTSQIRQKGFIEGTADAARAGTDVAEKTTETVVDTAVNNPVLTAGALSTAVVGGVAGGRALGVLGRGVKSRVRTLGGTKIDLEDVTQREVIDGDRTFPAAQNRELYQRDPAEAVRRQAADKTPDEIDAAYRQAGVEEGTTLKKAIEVEPEGPETGRAAQGLRVQKGDYESPGAFVGPELSPYFLGSKSSAGYSLRPGLPDFGGKPTAAVIRTDVENPDADDLAGLNRELRDVEGSTTAKTKPPSKVAPGEIEAIVPPGAKFADVGSGPVRNTLRRLGIGSDYYTTVNGRRVPLRVVADPDDIDAPGSRSLGGLVDDDPAQAGAGGGGGFRVTRTADDLRGSAGDPVDSPIPVAPSGGGVSGSGAMGSAPGSSPALSSPGGSVDSVPDLSPGLGSTPSTSGGRNGSPTEPTVPGTGPSTPPGSGPSTPPSGSGSGPPSGTSIPPTEPTVPGTGPSTPPGSGPSTPPSGSGSGPPSGTSIPPLIGSPTSPPTSTTSQPPSGGSSFPPTSSPPEPAPPTNPPPTSPPRFFSRDARTKKDEQDFDEFGGGGGQSGDELSSGWYNEYLSGLAGISRQSPGQETLEEAAEERQITALPTEGELESEEAFGEALDFFGGEGTAIGDFALGDDWV